MAVWYAQHLYISYKNFFFVPGSKCPAVIFMILAIRCDPVVLALLDQMSVFMISCCLLRNQCSVFLRDLCDIKLISESSGKCHMASCFKRRYTTNGMVRTVADMGSDHRKRIYKCTSLLDHQTLHCIRVI